MKYISGIFGIAICIVLLSFGQQQNTGNTATRTSNTDTIYWSADYQLTWSDFQGKVPKNSYDGKAATLSGLISAVSMSPEDEIIVNIQAVFSRRGSWVKQDGKTASILHHEQGHFNISEVYARRANQLMRAQHFTRANFQATADRIFNKIMEEWSQTQDLYDAATNHSIDTAQQRVWDAKIAKWLSETEG